MNTPLVEVVRCPLCGGDSSDTWASENKYTVVRCQVCEILYVNPRPNLASISSATQIGVHGEEAGDLNVVYKRVPGKVNYYARVLRSMYADRISESVEWLDIGAGYGEFVESVEKAIPNARAFGIEPMRPKAEAAFRRGLKIRTGFIDEVVDRYDVVSIINVFSHIPDFRSFLASMMKVLKPGGEVFIETGNAADIGDRRYYPYELQLPDHLVFAGERHVTRFLEESGFMVLAVERHRTDDGFIRLAKNVVKKAIGRKVSIQIPYTSPSRSLFFRARHVA